MAKVTITFESAAILADGPAVFTYEVDEKFAPDFVAAIAASSHGQVIEKVMQDSGQRTPEGEVILGEAWVPRETTFVEGLQSWSNMNVRDGIINAVNGYRAAKADAIRKATAPPVEPVVPI